jgi:hypothetical protein
MAQIFSFLDGHRAVFWSGLALHTFVYAGCVAIALQSF